MSTTDLRLFIQAHRDHLPVTPTGALQAVQLVRLRDAEPGTLLPLDLWYGLDALNTGPNLADVDHCGLQAAHPGGPDVTALPGDWTTDDLQRVGALWRHLRHCYFTEGRDFSALNSDALSFAPLLGKTFAEGVGTIINALTTRPADPPESLTTQAQARFRIDLPDLPEPTGAQGQAELRTQYANRTLHIQVNWTQRYTLVQLSHNRTDDPQRLLSDELLLLR